MEIVNDIQETVMKTYVVNMLKDESKRTNMIEQLESYPELDYEIFAAIEGRKLSSIQRAECISPKFKERYGKIATLPAAGCSLSHYEIYKSIVEQGINYALILEDDAILSPGIYSINKISRVLENDMPIAILLTPDFWYTTNSKRDQIDNNHILVELTDGYMTSGYLINQAGAKLLLDRLYPIQYTADAWSIFMSFGLKLYGIVPHIVSFPDGIGEIGQSQLLIEETKVQKLRHIVGRFKSRLYSVVRYIKGVRKSEKIW